jgi:hypothetical protein
VDTSTTPGWETASARSTKSDIIQLIILSKLILVDS